MCSSDLEKTSADDLRANSAGIVVSRGLATGAGAKGCWTERPRRCSNHCISISPMGSISLMGLDPTHAILK